MNKIKELCSYKELLKNLVIKELKVKYKRSVLGFFWSFLNPLVLMVIYTFVFSYVFKIPTKDFPIYLLVGLIPWNYLNFALSSGVDSIVGNANLVKKVYFPREILPLSHILSNLIDFLLQLTVLIVALVILGYRFYVFIPLFIAVVAIHTIFNTGCSLLFACANVYYRDVKYLVQVILIPWFFACPIVYEFSMFKHSSPLLQRIYKLNPMADIIMLYHDAFYYLRPPSIALLAYALGSSLAVFALGYYVFNRFSPLFAKEV